MGSAFIVWVAWSGTTLVSGQLSSTFMGGRFFDSVELGSGIHVSVAGTFGRYFSGDRLAGYFFCLVGFGVDFNAINGTVIGPPEDVVGTGAR